MAAGESVSNPGQVSILTFDSRYFASILPYGGFSTNMVSPCERLSVKAHTLEDVSCFRPDISGYSSKRTSPFYTIVVTKFGLSILW